MENSITDYKDFYIDLDGDVKATINNGESVFITETDKLNSKYFIAETKEEITNLLSKINPSFVIDIPILKQYSLKYDKNNNLKSIKVWVNIVEVSEGYEVIAGAFEIMKDKIIKETFFIASKEQIENYIEKNKLYYRIFEFETHIPILYSIKYDINTNNCNQFKTYYVRNEVKDYYTLQIANFIKNSLTF